MNHFLTTPPDFASTPKTVFSLAKNAMTSFSPLRARACAQWSRSVTGQASRLRMSYGRVRSVNFHNLVTEESTQPWSRHPRGICGTWKNTPASKLLANGLFWRGQVRGYSASNKPDGDPTLPNTPPKKPLLKALAQLTPHENIYTIPNILTFSRLIAAPIIGYLVLHDYHAWAVGLFAYAGITDLIDGYIARRWNLQTVVGTVIDPMADKTLMTILTVCLAVKGALPVWLAGIILGRDVGLAITAIYYRWISLPPPKTFARYWDFSLPSAEVHPTTISKYNTALQLALIGATTAMPLVTVDISTAMTAMQYLVATTTVWSGASYIYTKDAVKILNQEEKKDKEKPESVQQKQATGEKEQKI